MEPRAVNDKLSLVLGADAVDGGQAATSPLAGRRDRDAGLEDLATSLQRTPTQKSRGTERDVGRKP